MKNLFIALLCFVFAASGEALAQNADQIVGTYKAVQNGVNSKVKIFKHGDGYRAQVIWVDNLKMEDGTLRTDVKNPDPAKRKVQADQIVLVEKVTYNSKDKVWNGGKIYDPTSGKTYKVEMSFKDDKTLQVKGMLGPFFQRVYWTKL